MLPGWVVEPSTGSVDIARGKALGNPLSSTPQTQLFYGYTPRASNPVYGISEWRALHVGTSTSGENWECKGRRKTVSKRQNVGRAGTRPIGGASEWNTGTRLGT